MITGNVLAHKLLIDAQEIEDNVSCQIPGIEFQTSDIKGAGIMGTISMPMMGQMNSTTFAANLRAVAKKAAGLGKLGLRNIELRFARDTYTSNGDLVTEGTKIFISGFLKKLDQGKVEAGSAMDGSVEWEVVRMRQVVDGKETLLWDKQNYIYKINGQDQLASIRAVL